MKTKENLELRQLNYETFIILITFLSWVNTVLIFLLPDPDSRFLVLRTEQLLTILFLLDFLYRFNKAENRKQYFRRYGWLDLLSSFPFMRWLRVFRVYKTVQYLRKERGHRIFREFISNRADTAALSIILAVILLFEFASIFILRAEDSAPFANIKTAGDAVWWVLVTVATVGYGDLYPVTEDGRFIASFVIVAGVGLFGILSGFLTRNFLGGKSHRADDAENKNDANVTASQIDQILAELQEIRRSQGENREEQESTNAAIQERLAAIDKLLASKKIED